MPRRSYRFSHGHSRKVVGYYLLPDEEGARAAALSAWASSLALDLRATLSDDCPPATPLNERPGFAAALTALWNEQAGLLVVDRLGSLSTEPICHGMVAVLVGTFGADLVSAAVGEAIDWEALRPVAEAFTVFRDLDHRVRIQAGIEARKRQRRLTSRVPPYGWSVAKDGRTLVPNEAEQEVIRLAHRLRATGLPLREVGRRLVERGHRPRLGGDWNAQGIARLLEKKPKEAP